MKITSVSAISSILLSLLTNHMSTASHSPGMQKRCVATTIRPSLQVPVDSSAPDRVYGSSGEVTIWKKSSERRMLLKFDINSSFSTCTLKFISPANPPMSYTGSVDLHVWSLSEDVVSNDSWNTKPAVNGIVASGAIAPPAAVQVSFVGGGAAGCGGGGGKLNYEVGMGTAEGSVGFTAQEGLGFVVVTGC